MFSIPFLKHSLLGYLLKSNTSLTLLANVTMATKVLDREISKYSISCLINVFCKLKWCRPTLPDLSITKTISLRGLKFDEANKKYTCHNTVKTDWSK